MSALIHALQAFLRACVRLIVPGGLLAAVLLLLPRLPILAVITPSTPLFVALAALTIAGLGWRFGRGRLAYGALAVLLAGAIPLLPPGLQPVGVALLPLNLALLALLPERGILSLAGVARGGALLLQAALLAWLGTGAEPTVVATLTGEMAGPLSLVAAGTVLGLATLAVLGLRRREALVHGLFWAAVSVEAAALLALSLPPLWPTLVALVVLIVASIEDAHRIAYYDGLTRLGSRRALDERLPRMVGRYTVAMVDVDHFKKFNDRHGHDVGDQVLRMVAARLRETPGARAYRYGGEEFTLVFRGKSLQQAREELERLRKRIAERPFVIRGADRPAKKPKRPLFVWRERQKLTVTVSVGAAERSGWRHKPGEVVKEADQALYRAKKKGRNRVVA